MSLPRAARPLRGAHRRAALLALGLAAAGALAGCFRDLRHGGQLRPYDVDLTFPYSLSARTPPAHTVPRGQGRLATAFATGFDDLGRPLRRPPVPVTLALLERGRERYGIACAPCHGALGDGRGMVVRYGYPAPAAFDEPRLRDTSDGRWFDLVTRGRGAMTGQPWIDPADRWAIVAYVRALQRSRNATLADVPPVVRAGLLAGPGGGAR